ncbi:MAG: ribosome biogenesis GTPase YlqF, partial [Oscillospiraceae bacterium]
AKQWIRLAGKYELLDTPGILWPKFENEFVARKIAFTGGIKDEIIDIEELACYLLDYLKVEYSKNLQTRYKIEDEIEGMMGYDILEIIGKKRGCVMSGGRIDTFRAANMVLDDFRAAKMGNITLELPQ